MAEEESGVRDSETEGSSLEPPPAYSETPTVPTSSNALLPPPLLEAVLSSPSTPATSDAHPVVAAADGPGHESGTAITEVAAIAARPAPIPRVRLRTRRAFERMSHSFSSRWQNNLGNPSHLDLDLGEEDEQEETELLKRMGALDENMTRLIEEGRAALMRRQRDAGELAEKEDGAVVADHDDRLIQGEIEAEEAAARARQTEGMDVALEGVAQTVVENNTGHELPVTPSPTSESITDSSTLVDHAGDTTLFESVPLTPPPATPIRRSQVRKSLLKSPTPTPPSIKALQSARSFSAGHLDKEEEYRADCIASPIPASSASLDQSPAFKTPSRIPRYKTPATVTPSPSNTQTNTQPHSTPTPLAFDLVQPDPQSFVSPITTTPPPASRIPVHMNRKHFRKSRSDSTS